MILQESIQDPSGLVQKPQEIGCYSDVQLSVILFIIK